MRRRDHNNANEVAKIEKILFESTITCFIIILDRYVNDHNNNNEELKEKSLDEKEKYIKTLISIQFLKKTTDIEDIRWKIIAVDKIRVFFAIVAKTFQEVMSKITKTMLKDKHIVTNISNVYNGGYLIGEEFENHIFDEHIQTKINHYLDGVIAKNKKRSKSRSFVLQLLLSQKFRKTRKNYASTSDKFRRSWNNWNNWNLGRSTKKHSSYSSSDDIELTKPLLRKNA